MHLIASIRRVLIPGAAYDMCVCLISPQGYMKSKMLSMLYGEGNFLGEDISCKDTRTQSERTWQGINCVELPETLGDPQLSVRVRVDRIKAFITARAYKGVRQAYGRPENMRPMPVTFVIWHTRNTDQFLEDPTGNRRFLPMPLYDYMNEDWLRDNRDQLWSEVLEIEQRGQKEYYDNHPGMRRGEEKFPDIFLPEEYWEEAAELGRRHMKQGVVLTSYESLLKDLINQLFVIREPKATFVLLDDLRPYLHISEKQWISKSKEVTAILETLGWQKEQIWWRGKNRNGYVLADPSDLVT
jgi:Virulence-associated protein E